VICFNSRGIQTRRNFAATPDRNFVETLGVLILSFGRALSTNKAFIPGTICYDPRV
jgi:hypothetical protein